MCKSKVQGGQRCYPHAAAQLHRAEQALNTVRSDLKEAQAAVDAARKSGDKPAEKAATRKVASKTKQVLRAKKRKMEARAAFAMTPTGRRHLRGQIADLKAAGEHDNAAKLQVEITDGERRSAECHEQYATWRQTQPKGGSMSVHREGSVLVAVATSKNNKEPSPLPPEVDQARTSAESLAQAAPSSRPSTVDEDVAAHRSVSDAYADYNDRVDKVGERLAKHILSRRHGPSAYRSWRDERTGQGVDVKGEAAFSDWNKESVDSNLAASISYRAGTDKETTAKLIGEYQEVASVSGYRVDGLRAHNMQAKDFSTKETRTPTAVARNAGATAAPNEHTTHAVLSNGRTHYAAMNASVDAVDEGWDEMNDDEKIRSYLALRENGATLRGVRDSIEDRATAKVADNPSLAAGKTWSVNTGGSTRRKYPDKDATHAVIKDRIASDHAKTTGGDKTQARAALDMYGKVAIFNDPKVRGLTARGIDPADHTIQVAPRHRIVHGSNDATAKVAS